MSEELLTQLMVQALPPPKDFTYNYLKPPFDLDDRPDVNKRDGKKQPTDARNLLAGFYDLGPSIPMLASMLSAGVNTIGREIGEAFDFYDKPRSFADNFKVQLNDGWNRSLLEAGAEGMEAVNEFVNTEHPTTWQNQLMRSASLAAPIPGLQVLGAGSNLANIGKTAVNVLTPAVRTRPNTFTSMSGALDFAGRGATQVGAMATIDQGLLSMLGTPTLADDIYDAVIEDFPELLKSIDFSLVGEAGAEESPQIEFESVDDELRGGSADDALLSPEFSFQDVPVEKEFMFEDVSEEGQRQFQFEDVDSDQLVPLKHEDFVLDPVVSALPEASQGVSVLRSLDAAVQEQETINDREVVAIAIGALLGGYAGIKGAQRFLGPNPNRTGVNKFLTEIDPLQFGSFKPEPIHTYIRSLPGTLKNGYQGAEDAISAGFVDRSLHMRHALRDTGYGPRAIQSVTENAHVDPRGIAEALHTTGRWGQGYKPRWDVRPLREIATDYHALSGETRKILDDAVLARSRKVQLTQKAKEEGTLFPTAKGTELDKTIKLATDNPETAKLLTEFGHFLDNHLDYMVKRGRLSSTEAEKFRGKFGVTSTESSFMPIYSANRFDFFNNLAKFFGVHTRRGKEIQQANEILSLRFRGTDEIVEQMSPIEAMELYSRSVIEHVSTNSYWKESLSALAGVRISGSKVTRRDFAVDETGRVTEDPNGLGIVYLGRGEIDEAGDVVNVEITAKSKFKDGSLADVEKQANGEIFTVHDDGVPHVFHVPDKGVQRSLDISPHLGGPLMFFNHYKTLMTNFTVGKWSPFAPISNLYALEQSMGNLAAREGILPALQLIPRNIQGTGALAWESFSREMSVYLSQRLASNMGILNILPGSAVRPVEALQRLLEKSFKGRMSNQLRAETGRLGTGQGVQTFGGTLLDFKNRYGKEYASHFPGINEATLLARMFKGFVSAFQEGPAYGIELMLAGQARRAGKDLTPKLSREIAEEAKRLTGDMRRTGSNPVAMFAQSAIPFYTATIQSWATIGSAIKTNPGRYLAGITAFIAVPTASELAFNQMLSLEGETFSDPGGQLNYDGTPKMWSYMDYYWNGFTDLQRASNRIVFRPGKPPWQAIMIPISPEWGLVRGIVLDGMNELYGYNRVGSLKEMAERGELEWLQTHVGLARVADVPLPPAISAALSQLGIRAEVGLQPEMSTDPANPGPAQTVLKSIPIPTGDRLTGLSESRAPGGEMDPRYAASIQDLGGAGGTGLVAVHEAFFAGLKFDPEEVGMAGSFEKATEMAFDAAGESAKSQTRYLGGLWNKAVRTNINRHPVTIELFGKVQALHRLNKSFALQFSGGQASRALNALPGNTGIAPDDPVWRLVAKDAQVMLSGINVLSSDIQSRREKIASLQNASNQPSIEARNDRIDALSLEILGIRHMQLVELYRYEDALSELLSKKFGREININLSTLTWRADLPGRSADQELGNLPQISQ